MFKSTTLRAALALPVLSALLTALSSQPAPAQALRSFAGTPGQASVTIAPAAVVASSAHYQAKLALNCTPSFCSGDFPAPGAKHLLNLTRINCVLVASGGSTFADGDIELQNSNNHGLLAEFLPTVYSSSDGFHTLNEAVDVQVASSQHIHVSLNLASGTTSQAICAATGTLDTLQ